MANPKGKAVLDLGAGTGNVSAALGHEQPRSIVAIDLVAGALDRLRQKVRADVPVKTILSSADGSSIVAMRRFLSGDIAGVSGLAGRIPGVHQNMVQQLGKHYTAALHAVARGAQMSASEARGAEHLEARAVDLVHDLGVFSNFALGRLAPEEGKARIKTLAPSIFDEHAGLPCGDTEFDSVVCSLVLSYLDHPEDALFEMMRVLKPRGELIISSMKRDADSSMLYTDLIAYLESAPAEELATEVPRERLVAAARQFANQAAELLRLEEEGVFTFWSGRELTQLVQQAGFVDVISMTSFGTPGQAVIVKGTKPK